ncbi:hypothetical protein [Streptomyces sp. NPDC059063]|uniref:hypothetical protein n=1 Tax=unclassified Streptomyces TaxID=2593676 RepID=UPI0036A5012B
MSTHPRTSVLRRTAAVAALVGGALLLPATGAFADTPAPAPSATATTSPTASPAASPTASTERGPIFSVTLGNGAKAKVQNRGGAYVAVLSVGGKSVATLSSTHPTVTHQGVRYELYPVNGHIGITYLAKNEGGKGKGGTESVTPRGGVKAGADGLKDGGNPAFLVAGGGMAAAGAAGLGFAMMRRGRTDV